MRKTIIAGLLLLSLVNVHAEQPKQPKRSLVDAVKQADTIKRNGSDLNFQSGTMKFIYLTLTFS